MHAVTFDWAIDCPRAPQRGGAPMSVARRVSAPVRNCPRRAARTGQRGDQACDRRADQRLAACARSSLESRRVARALLGRAPGAPRAHLARPRGRRDNVDDSTRIEEQHLDRQTPPPRTSRSWRPIAGGRPTRLGEYDILAKIASGGMATVYLAHHVRPDGERTAAAVKVVRHELSDDGYVHRMFLDEAAILERLTHPNIVRMLGCGVTEERRYIAMELLLGHTVMDLWKACVARKISLRPEDIAWMGARVADALCFAHNLTDAQGKPLDLIHRDVNPTNIFLTYDGSLKLFDFGFAKSTGQRARTAAGIVKGKLPYLSPEQVMQLPLDGRSDIFALGTTLWEMATMRRLFTRDNDAHTLAAVRGGPIPDPRTFARALPADLAAIILKALQRNRENRYATAAEIGRDLDAFACSLGAEDVPGRIAAILEMLFPEERSKQLGWVRAARLA
jgi:serine/threonine-protein kinase